MEEPNAPERNDPYKEFEPKTVDVDLGEVVRIIRENETHIIENARKPGGWKKEDIKKIVEEEHESSFITVTALASVAKGQEPVVVFPYIRGFLHSQ